VNGKFGIIGPCSGGRYTFLSACRISGFDAAVDLWGGSVVVDKPGDLSPQRPVAPIDYTEGLSCPLLGIFGNEDMNPTPDHVSRLEEALKRYGKSYEFHRYEGAGHGFFYDDRPSYRQKQAMDWLGARLELLRPPPEHRARSGCRALASRSKRQQQQPFPLAESNHLA